jgi:hypothetical protein
MPKPFVFHHPRSRTKQQTILNLIQSLVLSIHLHPFICFRQSSRLTTIPFLLPISNTFPIRFSYHRHRVTLLVKRESISFIKDVVLDSPPLSARALSTSSCNSMLDATFYNGMLSGQQYSYERESRRYCQSLSMLCQATLALKEDVSKESLCTSRKESISPKTL